MLDEMIYKLSESEDITEDLANYNQKYNKSLESDIKVLREEKKLKQDSIVSSKKLIATEKAAQQDLQVEFSPTVASKILRVYSSDPQKFITMLQSGLNHLVIEKEQKKQASPPRLALMEPPLSSRTP